MKGRKKGKGKEERGEEGKIRIKWRHVQPDMYSCVSTSKRSMLATWFETQGEE